MSGDNSIQLPRLDESLAGICFGLLLEVAPIGMLVRMRSFGLALFFLFANDVAEFQ